MSDVKKTEKIIVICNSNHSFSGIFLNVKDEVPVCGIIKTNRTGQRRTEHVTVWKSKMQVKLTHFMQLLQFQGKYMFVKP